MLRDRSRLGWRACAVFHVKHALDEALLAALEPGALYAVGGRVRDELRAERGEPVEASADLDYVVTGTSLEPLLTRLRTVGKVDVVGASFAVVKLTSAVGNADIALPRRERSTGVGHRDFAVEAGPEVPLADDLARRDFRINMMARAVATGELIDPYGGVADIEARRIDILRPQAFDEDPLRMLRACQFAARFNYAISGPTAEAMRKAAPSAATVAAERVAEELWKLLRAPRPSYGIEWMRESGVLEWVWPELLEGFRVAQNEWHAYDVYRHNLETLDAAPPGDPVLRLAALLHDIGKPRTKDRPHFYRHEHAGEGMVHAMPAACGSRGKSRIPLRISCASTCTRPTRRRLPRRSAASSGASGRNTWNASLPCASPTWWAAVCPSAVTPTNASRPGSSWCLPRSRHSRCATWRSAANTWRKRWSRGGLPRRAFAVMRGSARSCAICSSRSPMSRAETTRRAFRPRRAVYRRAFQVVAIAGLSPAPFQKGVHLGQRCFT